jgi:hypothetical protein
MYRDDLAGRDDGGELPLEWPAMLEQRIDKVVGPHHRRNRPGAVKYQQGVHNAVRGSTV